MSIYFPLTVVSAGNTEEVNSLNSQVQRLMEATCTNVPEEHSKCTPGRKVIISPVSSTHFPSRQAFSLSSRSLYIYTEFLKHNCSFELPYKDLKNADTLPATRSWLKKKKCRYS